MVSLDGWDDRSSWQIAAANVTLKCKSLSHCEFPKLLNFYSTVSARILRLYMQIGQTVVELGVFPIRRNPIRRN